MAGTGVLEGRVAVVTGAGAGLGRAEAEALASAGATIVLNDLTEDAAQEAAEAVRAHGVEASVVAGDVGERDTADTLLAAAVEGHGRLDIVINNAGITRDRMLFSMSDEEWDAVVRVHLRGHFLLSRGAAAHWRAVAKAGDGTSYGRLVNTASEAFLVGPPGQPNYAAAKAGITALTLSAARGLSRFAVTANAICPRARTAMTAGVFGEDTSGQEVDPLSPAHVAPLVAWLASPGAQRVSGQVFVAYGGMVALLAAPTVERRFDATGTTWDLADLDAQLGTFFEGRDPSVCFAADAVMQLQV